MTTFLNEILRLIFEYVYLLAYVDNLDDDEDLTWSLYFIFGIDNIEYGTQCDMNSLIYLGSSLKQ